MQVHCYTRLPIKDTWPETLDRLPTIGEKSEAKSGLRLRVINVVFRYDGSADIELHIMHRHENTKVFYEECKKVIKYLRNTPQPLNSIDRLRFRQIKNDLGY